MIGLLGGTFDPVHFGHLRPALELFETLALDELRLIPCRIPPHRQAPVADAEQRARMLELALTDQAGIKVDRRELSREGPSYSVDTLVSLREELGAERPLCLILGMDAFLGLKSWHRWEMLPELAHIVVSHRPGSAIAGTEALGPWLHQARVDNPEALRRRPAGHVLFQGVTQLDISATTLRALIRGGRDPRYLLPDAVRGYIRREGLYA